MEFCATFLCNRQKSWRYFCLLCQFLVRMDAVGALEKGSKIEEVHWL